MTQPEWLVMFTTRRHLTRILSDLLLLSLIMLADGWVLVRLARTTGVYLALALEAGVAIVAVVVVGSSINKQILLLRRSALNGEYRPTEFARLAAMVVAATLLVLPGFAGDGLGVLIYVPPGRHLFMTLFLRRYRHRLPAVYEYLTMSVYSDDGER